MTTFSFSAARWLRVGLFIGILTVLLLLGSNDLVVFKWLTRQWQLVSRYLPASLDAATDPAVTTRPLPVVGAYTLLYVGLCLALLGTLLGTWQRFRFALLAYAGSAGLCLLLLAVGKITHNSLGLYHLGRNMIDFTVSPLPVIGLAPLLFWYYPATRKPLPAAES